MFHHKTDSYTPSRACFPLFSLRCGSRCARRRAPPRRSSRCTLLLSAVCPFHCTSTILRRPILLFHNHRHRLLLRLLPPPRYRVCCTACRRCPHPSCAAAFPLLSKWFQSSTLYSTRPSSLPPRRRTSLSKWRSRIAFFFRKPSIRVAHMRKPRPTRPHSSPPSLWLCRPRLLTHHFSPAPSSCSRPSTHTPTTRGDCSFCRRLCRRQHRVLPVSRLPPPRRSRSPSFRCLCFPLTFKYRSVFSCTASFCSSSPPPPFAWSSLKVAYWPLQLLVLVLKRF